MIYLGIDIAKTNHYGAFIDESGNLIGKSFKFTNSNEGFQLLLSNISVQTTNKAGILIAMEATGHYWLALYSALFDAGYNVSVYNPFQIKGFRPAFSVRKVKNDKVDANIIAQYIRVFGPSNTLLPQDDLLSLKQLTRYRKYQVDMIASLKTQVIGILDRIFPEYTSIFSDTFGTTSTQLLLTAPTPDEILNMDLEKLTKLLYDNSKGRFDIIKAKQIKTLAKNSFGVKFTLNACSFEIKQIINQIIFLESQIKEIESAIKVLYEKLDTHLLTIPGVGAVTAPVILAEIGDINKFSKPSQLIAFAGIDPSEKQSGNQRSTDDKTSKRGSPFLRYAIHCASLVSMSNIPEFREYYLKKRKEGKHHNIALAAISRKLVTIIYHVLKENRDYRPYKLS